jgi:hypothetical protein
MGVEPLRVCQRYFGTPHDTLPVAPHIQYRRVAEWLTHGIRDADSGEGCLSGSHGHPQSDGSIDSRSAAKATVTPQP